MSPYYMGGLFGQPNRPSPWKRFKAWIKARFRK